MGDITLDHAAAVQVSRSSWTPDDEEGMHAYIEVSVVPQQQADLVGPVGGLPHGVTEVGGEDPTVNAPEDTGELGLDGEDAGGTDGHVVNVEAMEWNAIHEVSAPAAQRPQGSPRELFGFASVPQATRSGTALNEPPDRHGDNGGRDAGTEPAEGRR